MITINKYYVKLLDAKGILKKASTIIAASPEEAINSTRHEKWWYDEGTGYDYKKMEYPLTFTAEISNT